MRSLLCTLILLATASVGAAAVLPAEPIFRLNAPVATLATDEAAFVPFAREVSLAANRLMQETPLEKGDRLKTLLAIEVHTALHLGDDTAALRAAAGIRSLQSDAMARAYAGVMTEAIVAARSEHARRAASSFVAIFRSELDKRLEALPVSPAMRANLEEQRRQIDVMSRASLLGDLRGIPSGAAGRPGYCTLDEAGRIVRARQKLADILPLRPVILDELAKAIAARPRERHATP